MSIERYRLEVRGDVQGVGFRPFVYRLAALAGLGGFVCNTGEGVTIEVEGAAVQLAHFRACLHSELAPPAAIHQLCAVAVEPRGERAFVVAQSATEAAPSAPIMPDLAMCEDCRREVLDPSDRRFGYSFTTCQRCGPRYSILAALPYDRERTTMAAFAMCAACRAEYENPRSRRFHAETIACADCGPRLALWDGQGDALALGDGALERATAALRQGAIVALKGLGGFQLLVDATDEAAVQRLRERKRRSRKPFALMCASLAQIEGLAEVSEFERTLLRSAAAPIVLLSRRAARDAGPRSGARRLADGVAPVGPSLGVMLPYTPLHELLLRAAGRPLVATSGNLHGEPIVTDERDALERLAGIADLWLVHDRPILRSIDDSVVRVMAGQAVILRRARGFAPAPLAYRAVQRPLLALGGQQKNAIATAFGGKIFLGPHIGDLASPRARAVCARMAIELPGLHTLAPLTVVCDRHPDYFTSRLASNIANGNVHDAAVRQVSVPHHLAHVLACQVDNAVPAPLLGIAWDGSGYGDDGTLWGGECLLVSDTHYRRCAHLLPFALPGGEAAVREPRRAALGVLHGLYGEGALQRAELAPVATFNAGARKLLAAMLARTVNSPMTSSVGRLFDAAAALLQLCQIATFEGEAAMALEAAADEAAVVADLPGIELCERDGCYIMDWRPPLRAMIEAVCGGRVALAALAAAFHDTLAQAIVGVAERIATAHVLLTGGCFQNARLLEGAVSRLRAAGFSPYWHQRVPPNDGGLAVGQIAFAARPLRKLGSSVRQQPYSPSSLQEVSSCASQYLVNS